jgi:hypothetical protein
MMSRQLFIALVMAVLPALLYAVYARFRGRRPIAPLPVWLVGAGLGALVFLGPALFAPRLDGGSYQPAELDAQGRVIPDRMAP